MKGKKEVKQRAKNFPPKQSSQASKKPSSKKIRSYVIDTSILASKKLSELITKKGLRGKVIIPDAAVAELENQANQGKEVGFDGLDELANLHQLKKKYSLQVEFAPPRPSAHEIRFAKSGAIDALIRSLAYGKQATIVTSDFVQAKSAAAYGITVWFIKSKPREEKKKGFLPFFSKR